MITHVEPCQSSGIAVHGGVVVLHKGSGNFCGRHCGEGLEGWVTNNESDSNNQARAKDECHGMGREKKEGKKERKKPIEGLRVAGCLEPE